MNPSAVRSVEVDFLRGIALIVIAIDHVSLSVLSHATLHAYAYCDAAEVFVFLGGYASAAGYDGLVMQRGQAAARERFMRRTWEIYCAYWLTAALMLASGAMLTRLPMTSPLTGATDWPTFAQHPWRVLTDIAVLREQPYLSSILPMYMLFALTAPIAAPFARRKPVAAFTGSLAVWLAAPWLAQMLPAAGTSGWPFNPFAWQLMFMLGMLCRLHPVPATTQTSGVGRWLTGTACVVAVTIAILRLSDPHVCPGYMKQNLASVRVVSFLSLAWLCGQAVRLGRIRELARHSPGVVTVGKQGLCCCVGGSVTSIAVDTALRLAQVHGNIGHLIGLSWLFRVSGDVATIFTILLIARISSDMKALQSLRAEHGCFNAHGPR